MGEYPPAVSPFHVAIVGGGLAGLSLALSLHRNDVSCIVYEASDKPERVINGSLQLAPNGQAALDDLDILPRLNKYGRFYKVARVHDNAGNLKSEILLGDEDEFGYDCMRIIRGVLVRELAATARERGIEIACNKKFTSVMAESKSNGEPGVQVKFADGTVAEADLLVGADGIHSKVRREIFPTAAEPTYIGNVVVTSSCARDDIEGLDAAASSSGMYISPEAGTFIFGGHVPNDLEYMVGLQRAFPDRDRDGWREFAEDKKAMRVFMEQGIETWPAHVQSAIRNARDESLGLWTLRVLPQLDSWISIGQGGGRVVLVGDAAHAIPPSAGQGTNMAFEDGDTLGRVLGFLVKQRQQQQNSPGTSVEEALEFWQAMRQKRIERVLEMTIQWNKMRQTAAEREKMGKGEIFESASTHASRIEQMRWLFSGVDTQRKQIEDWIAIQDKSDIRPDA